ncbi:MAG: hypothetical protein ABIH71_05565 [Candidatus Omnitrophota bacterium]
MKKYVCSLIQRFENSQLYKKIEKHNSFFGKGTLFFVNSSLDILVPEEKESITLAAELLKTGNTDSITPYYEMANQLQQPNNTTVR